jgi:DMSO/TMAO reductase YedYZ molybdopterin-dependent catalytic subunit
LPGEPQVKGLSSYVTSNKDFYTIDTAIVAPQVHPDTWELRIHGRVDRPFTINFAELTAMPMVERFITLACVSNPVGGDLIGNAKWLGIPVKGLLEKAGPQAGADQVVMRSADGWTCGAPTAALMDGRDALLAVGMNGEPLPVRHGFPVRMVVPGLYGYVSACKWITEIELTSFADYDAFWIENGWAEQGPIKTQSRIDVPRPGATVEAGEVIIAGVAWAQHRGITVVEVQVDDGPWEAVELAGTVSADTWRQWTHRWRATAGQHEISVRAADTTGQPQTDDIAAPFPDGATGYHRISVSVL